ncbi:anthranilate synthase component II [Aquiflexum lacus]|uniref:anthranilate synthase component II n=1 Tax=Aquiflexum lacus TaxID=2483805 RepID=UPI001893CAA2|nr:aminodeoxychorismate/anthranilate synthase component II [Aquiflexum lacus]
MVLLIDNFDSFSHILADYFRQVGMKLEIFRNDVDLEIIKEKDWDGLILSPGPEVPMRAGNLLSILEYYHDKIPVLGICLGHQAIGEFFGGKLVKSQKPVHGKVHSVFQLNEHEILSGIPSSFEVTRYHSLEIANIPDCLQVLLETKDQEVMAMVHRSLPVVGIQYHPEAFLTQFGVEIIRNWVRYYRVGIPAYYPI